MPGPTDGPRAAAGWHGKLPSLGDFSGRGLDTRFTEAWDDWVATGLASLREREPERWLAGYLSSPTWRFVLTPGLLPGPPGDSPWAGVLMPSVDRVGRYYPLTLASPLRDMPRTVPAQRALWAWLQELQDAAVDALQDDWDINTLEAELARLGRPPDPSPSTTPTSTGPGPARAAPGPMDNFFAQCLDRATGPHCLWYSETDLLEPRILRSTRLDASIRMLWTG